MGFRGSRVQIPPSRLGKVEYHIELHVSRRDCLCGSCIAGRWWEASGRFRGVRRIWTENAPHSLPVARHRACPSVRGRVPSEMERETDLWPEDLHVIAKEVLSGARLVCQS